MWMIIVALLLIVMMWYITSSRYTNTITVDVSGTEAKVVSDWYNRELVLSTEIITEDPVNRIKEVASQLLREVYDIEISNSSSIIVGTTLNEQYYQLTNKILVLGRTVFDLREILGIPLQIALIDPRWHSSLLDMNDDNLSLLIAIVEQKAHTLVQPYLAKLLEQRWTQLQELQDPRILNNSGTYVLVQSNTAEILPNTFGLLMGNKVRLNLLCPQREFNLILQRWRAHAKGNVFAVL